MCAVHCATANSMKRHFQNLHIDATDAQWWELKEMIKFQKDSEDLPCKLCSEEANICIAWNSSIKVILNKMN